MWSGPRNISTALMRAFENRPDTCVCDEPFYAHYLRMTELPHPGREEVIASQENDWRKVAAWLTTHAPEGKAVFYQKHMTHHLLPGMGRGWLMALTNCFLIRDPQAMLLSLDAKYPDPTLADTGLPQQLEIFETVKHETGAVPPVVDADDLLRNPRGMLEKLCSALGLPFSDRMLHWPSGPRATDGVWARYWYQGVWRSTGFRRPRKTERAVPGRLESLHGQCRVPYEVLYAHRLTV
ncbi:MAG: HAD family hydrolase [Gammaproteobacteria bacterium]|nr:HAD family hydrolase [Gammaproteobacteria bacterium]